MPSAFGPVQQRKCRLRMERRPRCGRGFVCRMMRPASVAATFARLHDTDADSVIRPAVRLVSVSVRTPRSFVMLSAECGTCELCMGVVRPHIVHHCETRNAAIACD